MISQRRARKLSITSSELGRDRTRQIERFTDLRLNAPRRAVNLAGMTFPEPRLIETNGVTLQVHEAGPEDGFPVLLLHGWPELAYSWKNVMPALAAAGFRAIAPNMRGFGGSDAPRDVEAYGMETLVADMTGLLDALDLDQAAWCGHDWGGLIVWPAALLAPERVAGVIGVNTPQIPPTEIDQVELLRQVYGDDHYIVRFQEPGVEARFRGQEDRFFEFVFGAPPKQSIDGLPPAEVTHLFDRFREFTGRVEDDIVIGPEDRHVYAEAYRKSGFGGGINYYRNMNANWRLMRGYNHDIKETPCLMVAADRDWFLPPLLTEGMDERIEDLELHVLEGVGHWTMWEAPDRLNALMTDWLGRKFG